MWKKTDDQGHIIKGHRPTGFRMAMAGLALLALAAASMISAGDPETATAGVKPRISLNPTSGPPGTRVTVTGTSFLAGEGLLTWDRSGQDMPKVEVGPEGTFGAMFVVPEDGAGGHEVQAVIKTGSGRQGATTRFRLKRAVPTPTARPTRAATRTAKPTATATPTTAATAARSPTPTATRTAAATPTPTSTPTAGGVWRPAQNTTWQWQLSGTLDLSVAAQLWDIDLFDNSASVVATLHSQGRKAICYMSAGSWEDWRPDAGDFPQSVLGGSNGWPGERWLDIRQLDVLGPIMGARLDLCRNKGFDGVEFDNIDGYDNNTGLPLRYSDQIAYNTWLANAAHERGLSAGFKNDLAQVADLEPLFDFAVVEECFQYGECDGVLPFTEAGKAVFEVEYSGTLDSFCPEANAMGFMSMKKDLDLDAWRQPCWN